MHTLYFILETHFSDFSIIFLSLHMDTEVILIGKKSLPKEGISNCKGLLNCLPTLVPMFKEKLFLFLNYIYVHTHIYIGLTQKALSTELHFVVVWGQNSHCSEKCTHQKKNSLLKRKY